MCESFGERVKKERERLGWNHSDLSKASGVSRAAIIRVENNPDLNMRLERALRLAKALDTSLDYLSGRFERCEGDK